MYEFEFEIFNYSLNLYLLNGVSWHKIADIIDLSLVTASFCIGCVMTTDIKDGSLVYVDSNRHKKWTIFCILQRVSDSRAGTKDRLPVGTINLFCSSARRVSIWEVCALRMGE
jgi:hypothetical protein